MSCVRMFKHILSQSRRLPPLSGGECQQICLSGNPISDWDKRSARMRSDSVKNMSAYADQNHAPSLAVARLEYYMYSRSLSCKIKHKEIPKVHIINNSCNTYVPNKYSEHIFRMYVCIIANIFSDVNRKIIKIRDVFS